ncbi:hypothetical protein HUJ05_003384 [Dendroctonus ponderosae]|nr:hypothetical protein HUJ05_003384 [Dendroctonus ponderosae]
MLPNYDWNNCKQNKPRNYKFYVCLNKHPLHYLNSANRKTTHQSVSYNSQQGGTDSIKEAPERVKRRLRPSRPSLVDHVQGESSYKPQYYYYNLRGLQSIFSATNVHLIDDNVINRHVASALRVNYQAKLRDSLLFVVLEKPILDIEIVYIKLNIRSQ